MITRRSRGAGAAKVVAATLALVALLGATLTGDSRRVTGHVQSADEFRVACATEAVVVDITTQLGYPPWGRARATGVIIDARGDVLTNNHVVAGAAVIRLRTSDGAEYAGRVLATDIPDDLALLRIVGGAGFAAARLGDSSSLRVGEAVYAIGNGHGGCGTPQVNRGRITGLDRRTTVSDEVNGNSLELSGLIMSEVAVEPGYSGGALLDERGAVIGILTAGRAPVSCDCYGSVFAIPVDKAARIAAQMAAGVSSASVHIGPTASLGVTVGGSADVTHASFLRGAMVTYVAPGSPAGRAGLAPGAQIVALDGRPVRCALDLVTLLQTRRPGQSVRLRWIDDLWRTHTATAVLTRGVPQ